MLRSVPFSGTVFHGTFVDGDVMFCIFLSGTAPPTLNPVAPNAPSNMLNLLDGGSSLPAQPAPGLGNDLLPSFNHQAAPAAPQG